MTEKENMNMDNIRYDYAISCYYVQYGKDKMWLSLLWSVLTIQAPNLLVFICAAICTAFTWWDWMKVFFFHRCWLRTTEVPTMTGLDRWWFRNFVSNGGKR
jgi:hypothetical protein